MMGLLGDLIGGAFGLAADVTGAVINAGIEAHNEKKLQQQIDNNAGMLDEFMNSCIAEGKESAINTKYQLYTEGLTAAADDIVKMLQSGSLHVYMKNIRNDDALDTVFRYVENMYTSAFVVYEKYATNDTMKKIFVDAKNGLLQKLNDKIHQLLTMPNGFTNGFNKYENIIVVLPFLCMIEKVSGDSNFLQTINSLHNYEKNCTVIFTSLHPLEHGEFELDDPEIVAIDKVYSKIQEVEMHLADNRTGYYEGIRNYLDSDFLLCLGMRMWYYASLTPFDQSAFDEAGDCLNKYKALQGNVLERVLAEVYVKNKLGGEMLVMQNIDEIMEKASVRNPVYARALCSFLAWIECYQVELEVLKKAVQEKIQLTSDMLERLEFLSKGGATNKIKVYDISPSHDCFYFDSSTEGIDMNGIEALFETLQKKRKILNYSLCINKWTKTIPMPKGKMFSVDALNAAFAELVEDFDGEILYRTSNAIAVNLANLSYQNCALFQFTTERSKGITMLFDCEKFGRNLNVSILTLFTPDESMGAEMGKYARAVSGNRYAESFRESILQALDASLKDKTDVYDESSGSTTSSIFE